LIKACHFDISKVSNVTSVERVSLRTIIIITWGEMISTRCPGKVYPPVRLNPGTYMMHCPAPCNIAGTGWRVHCIPEIHMSQRVALPPIRIDGQFNFTHNLNHQAIIESFPQLKGTTTVHVKDVSEEMLLNAIKLSGKTWVRIKKHAPATSLAISLIVVLLVLAVWGFWATRKSIWVQSFINRIECCKLKAKPTSVYQVAEDSTVIRLPVGPPDRDDADF
jgi:hypothetical protein